jgi:WD40 repeat protein
MLTNALLVAVISSPLLTAAGEAHQPKPLLTLRARSPALRVQFSPGGGLATAHVDQTVALWDARTGERLLTLQPTAPYRSLAFSPGGKRLATGDSDGWVRVWDTRTGKAVLSLKAHDDCGSAVAFSPAGKYLASAGAARDADHKAVGEVKVWHARTGKLAMKRRVLGRAALSVAYSPDGKRLAAAGEGAAVLWESATGEVALTLRGHKGVLFRVAFSPDGRRLVTGGSDGKLLVRHLGSGRECLWLDEPNSRVAFASFSPDGRWLAATVLSRTGTRPPGWLGELRVWDAATGKGHRVLGGTEREGVVYAVGFSPDGRRLATTHEDGTVRVWSVRQLFDRARCAR